MPRTTSAAALEAMFAQQTDLVILPFLIVEEASLSAPLYLVNNTAAVDRDRGDGAGTKTYVPMRFALTPPSEDNGTIREIQIVVDNISQALRDAIELATERPKFTLEYVRHDTPDADPEAGPFEFNVESAQYDAAIATVTLRYTEVFQLRYPQHSFIPAFFPDLFD